MLPNHNHPGVETEADWRDLTGEELPFTDDITDEEDELLAAMLGEEDEEDWDDFHFCGVPLWYDL